MTLWSLPELSKTAPFTHFIQDLSTRVVVLYRLTDFLSFYGIVWLNFVTIFLQDNVFLKNYNKNHFFIIYREMNVKKIIIDDTEAEIGYNAYQLSPEEFKKKTQREIEEVKKITKLEFR